MADHDADKMRQQRLNTLKKARRPGSSRTKTNGPSNTPPPAPLQDQSQNPKQKTKLKLCARFPTIVASVTVDSATGVGIEQLRELISHHAARLPLMGAPWPEDWAAGAGALRALPAVHTSLETARALLTDHQVSELDQNRLLAAFAELGDVLHYPDDPRLADTVVLQPEWLNTRIARLLDSHAVHDRGGQLLWSDIDTEWADVPANLREHFLTMMDRYDISYRVHEHDSATASIVTARLPRRRPDLTQHWPTDYSGRQIKLSYRLSFIPAGIPTWVITRTRRFALEHWRTSALMRDPATGALALIETAPDGDALRLTARGEHLERFLPLLLAELAHSLGRYPGLTVQRSTVYFASAPGESSEPYPGNAA
jgi:internalin A